MKKYLQKMWFLLGASILFGYFVTAILILLFRLMQLDPGSAGLIGSIVGAFLIGRFVAIKLNKVIPAETIVNLSLYYTLFQFALGSFYLKTNNVATADNFMALVLMSVVFFVLVLFAYKHGVKSVFKQAYLKKAVKLTKK